MRYIVVITLFALVLLAGCDDAPAALGSVGRWTGHCWRVKESHELNALGNDISESLPGQFVFLQSQSPKPDRYGQMFLEYGYVYAWTPAGMSKREQVGHTVCATKLTAAIPWDGGFQEEYDGVFR